MALTACTAADLKANSECFKQNLTEHQRKAMEAYAIALYVFSINGSLDFRTASAAVTGAVGFTNGLTEADLLAARIRIWLQVSSNADNIGTLVSGARQFFDLNDQTLDGIKTFLMCRALTGF